MIRARVEWLLIVFDQIDGRCYWVGALFNAAG